MDKLLTKAFRHNITTNGAFRLVQDLRDQVIREEEQESELFGPYTHGFRYLEDMSEKLACLSKKHHSVEKQLIDKEMQIRDKSWFAAELLNKQAFESKDSIKATKEWLKAELICSSKLGKHERRLVKMLEELHKNATFVKIEEKDRTVRVQCTLVKKLEVKAAELKEMQREYERIKDFDTKSVQNEKSFKINYHKPGVTEMTQLNLQVKDDIQNLTQQLDQAISEAAQVSDDLEQASNECFKLQRHSKETSADHGANFKEMTQTSSVLQEKRKFLDENLKAEEDLTTRNASLQHYLAALLHEKSTLSSTLAIYDGKMALINQADQNRTEGDLLEKRISMAKKQLASLNEETKKLCNFNEYLNRKSISANMKNADLEQQVKELEESRESEGNREEENANLKQMVKKYTDELLNLAEVKKSEKAARVQRLKKLEELEKESKSMEERSSARKFRSTKSKKDMRALKEVVDELTSWREKVFLDNSDAKEKNRELERKLARKECIKNRLEECIAEARQERKDLIDRAKIMTREAEMNKSAAKSSWWTFSSE